MGFHHQGITAAASVYNHHHVLSFQSNSHAISMGGFGTARVGFTTPRTMSGTRSTAGMFLSPNNNGTFGNASVVGPSSRSSSGDAFRGSTTASKYKFVTGLAEYTQGRAREQSAHSLPRHRPCRHRAGRDHRRRTRRLPLPPHRVRQACLRLRRCPHHLQAHVSLRRQGAEANIRRSSSFNQMLI